MPPIQPNIDAYGTYARASALADYLELCALLRAPMLKAALEDMVADRWERKTNELFSEGTGGSDGLQSTSDDLELDPESEPDVDPKLGDGDASQFSQRVFDLLDERAALLASSYPFTVGDDSVAARDDTDTSTSMYVVLLSVALAHAYKVKVRDDNDGPLDVKQVLEETVTRVLQRISPPAINVGKVSRDEKEFPKTVAAAAAFVGLKASPEVATYKKSANEEGVDVLAHLPVGDIRTGVWTFLGQVTCGESDTWEGKIAEPKEPLWKARLNTGVGPQCFLAVPHHVEPTHLGHLVAGSGRVVVDRLRLARADLTPSSDEKRVVEAVLATGVEQIA
jgi:hypothetical protein